MTTDQLAFLAKIVDQPDDDLPRLVYADWLQEHGETDRAEFIRVQIELAKMDQEKIGWRFIADGTSDLASNRAVRDEDPRREKLQRRERELYKIVSKDPYFSLITGPGNHGRHWYARDIKAWQRGLLHTIHFDLAAWLTHGPSIVRENPIQKVVCTDKEPYEETGVPIIYYWHRYQMNDNSHHANPSNIPDFIFDLFSQAIPPRYGRFAVSYLAKQAANDDLSQALIRWARSNPPTPT